jgi:organic hydroperoxide reductase OsmC/OhrA
MAKLDTYKNIFPHAKLTRSPDGVLEVVLHTEGETLVTAKIPGIDQTAFQSIAAKAKAGCPVSKLMKVEIGFGATLFS